MMAAMMMDSDGGCATIMLIHEKRPRKLSNIYTLLDHGKDRAHYVVVCGGVFFSCD